MESDTKPDPEGRECSIPNAAETTARRRRRRPNWLAAGLDADTLDTSCGSAAAVHEPSAPGAGAGAGALPHRPLRVLLSSLQHHGRAQSLLSIGSELIRRGHVVTFAMPSDFLPVLRKLSAVGPDASEIEILDSGPSKFDGGEREELMGNLTRKDGGDTLSIIKQLAGKVFDDACFQAPAYLELILEGNYDVLVGDLNAHALQIAQRLAKERHGRDVPLVTNHPVLMQGEINSGLRLQPGYYPAQNSRLLHDASFGNRAYNVIRRRTVSLLGRAAFRSIDAPRSCADLGFDAAPPPAKGVTVVGTAFGFEVPHETPPHVVHAGPMIDLSVLPRDLAESDEDVAWASDEGRCPRGVFYVSLGTSVTLAADELNVLARTVIAATSEHDGVCFLWSLRRPQQDLLDDDVRRALEEESDGGRLRVSTFVSQRLFLRWAPVVGCLTQGGVASVSESLYFGVPMVILPFLFDQIDLAARVRSVGGGIDCGSDRPHGPTAVKEAIATVIEDDAYRGGALRVARLFRRAGGVGRAVDVIEDVAEFGGDHLIPIPYGQNLPWYVYGDTDVVLFLTCLGLAVSFAIVKGLMSIFRRIRRKLK